MAVQPVIALYMTDNIYLMLQSQMGRIAVTDRSPAIRPNLISVMPGLHRSYSRGFPVGADIFQNIHKTQ